VYLGLSHQRWGRVAVRRLRTRIFLPHKSQDVGLGLTIWIVDKYVQQKSI
jgi:hypothetical protein